MFKTYQDYQLLETPGQIKPFEGGGKYFKVDEPKKWVVEVSSLMSADKEYDVMDISPLFNCLGMVLVFRPYSDESGKQSYLLGFHLKPVHKNHHSIQNYFINNFILLKDSHYVAAVIVAGGRTCDPAWQVHYKNSTNIYFKQFMKLPFLKYTNFIQFLPQEKAIKTHMWLAGNRIIIIQALINGSVVYKEFDHSL